MDRGKRMYIGYAASMKSGNHAFRKSMERAARIRIGHETFRLDVDYSWYSILIISLSVQGYLSSQRGIPESGVQGAGGNEETEGYPQSP